MSTRWRRFGMVALGATLVMASGLTVAPITAQAAGDYRTMYGNGGTRDGGGLAINSSRVETASASIQTIIEPERVGQGKGYPAYCIQRFVTPGGIGMGGGYVTYVFDQSATELLPKQVVWLARNGYPFVSVEDLNAKAGVNLGTQEMVSVTQAAIWTYTDKTDFVSLGGINKNRSGEGTGRTGEAQKLYKYLIDQAEANASKISTPTMTAALSIEKSAAVYSNGRVGPFRVSGAQDFVAMTVSSGTLVYADGSAVDMARVDAKKDLYVKTSQLSGSVSLTVKGNSVVQPGLVYAPDRGRQKVVTVGGWAMQGEATGTLTWQGSTPATETPTDQPTPPTDKPTTPAQGKPQAEFTPPTILTTVSKQRSNPGSTISDTVTIGGIVDTNLNYTITGGLYGPVKARNNSCTGLDFTKAPMALKIEPFRVIENGDFSNIGTYKIPMDALNVCYTYGETLTVTDAAGKVVTVVEHPPGKAAQTTLVSMGEASRGDSLGDSKPECNSGSNSGTKPGSNSDCTPDATGKRPLAETGASN